VQLHRAAPGMPTQCHSSAAHCHETAAQELRVSRLCMKRGNQRFISARESSELTTQLSTDIEDSGTPPEYYPQPELSHLPYSGMGERGGADRFGSVRLFCDCGVSWSCPSATLGGRCQCSPRGV
jgi:hypothetical protein